MLGVNEFAMDMDQIVLNANLIGNPYHLISLDVLLKPTNWPGDAILTRRSSLFAYIYSKQKMRRVWLSIILKLVVAMGLLVHCTVVAVDAGGATRTMTGTKVEGFPYARRSPSLSDRAQSHCSHRRRCMRLILIPLTAAPRRLSCHCTTMLLFSYILCVVSFGCGGTRNQVVVFLLCRVIMMDRE